MSEQAPNQSNTRTIIFMIILSFVCALILSLLASVLAEPIAVAKDLDRSKQMMIAAKILDNEGHFLIRNTDGDYVPAKSLKNGILIPTDNRVSATNNELLEIYKLRLIPMLIDKNNSLVTFKEAHINQEEYLSAYKKSGYYRHPYKLIYIVQSNPNQTESIVGGKQPVDGYVIPINGYGLWDAIYGYLAINPDGNTITGITWYDQKETPGLGANIAESPWQNLFPGKKLFQENANGYTDTKTAPIGITVVKGKVSEVLGNIPKAKSAVDGMAGATLTGNGVNDAFKNVLSAYRPFLIKLYEEQIKEKKP